MHFGAMEGPCSAKCGVNRYYTNVGSRHVSRLIARQLRKRVRLRHATSTSSISTETPLIIDAAKKGLSAEERQFILNAVRERLSQSLRANSQSSVSDDGTQQAAPLGGSHGASTSADDDSYAPSTSNRGAPDDAWRPAAGSGRQGTWQGPGAGSRDITFAIKQTASWQELLAVLESYTALSHAGLNGLNRIHVSAAASHLAKLIAKAPPGATDVADAVPSNNSSGGIHPAAQAPPAAGRLPAAAPRTDASSAPAPGSYAALLQLLRQLILQQMQYLEARQVANVAWAVACLGSRKDGADLQPVELLQALDGRAAKVAGFTPQEFSNLLYAFGVQRLQPSAPLLRQWYEMSRVDLRIFNPQELANTLWALARLRQQPPVAWLRYYLATMARKLQVYGPQELANSVWALGALRLHPGETALRQVEDVSFNMLERFGPQELSNTVWGFSKLGHVPSDLWVEKFAVQVQLRLSRCSPQQLCNLMYSVSRLKLRPLAGWVDTLLLELYYKFDALSHVNPEILMAMTFLALSNSAAASSSNSAAGSSSGVASTSSAASGGNGSSRPASDSNAADAAASASPAAAEPSASGNCGNGSGSSSATGASGNGSSSASATAGLDSWMSVASPRLVAAMPSFNAQDLSNLLWSFANAGYQPPGEVAAAALVAARRLVPSFSCQALANVLWASGRLGLAMDEPLLQLLLQHSQAQMRYFKPQEQSMLLWGIATQRPGTPLPAPWLADFVAQAFSRLGDFKAQEVAAVLWGLAATRSAPPPAFLNACLAEVEARLASCKPQEVSTVLWACARLGHAFDPIWVDDVLALVQKQIAQFKPQELANLAWALAKLHYRPEREWLARYMTATLYRLDSFKPAELTALLWALARFASYRRLAAPRAWMDKLAACSIRSLPALAPHELATTLASLAALRAPPATTDDAWWGAVLAACQQRLPAMNTATLTKVAAVLERLAYRPGDAWMQAFEAAIAARARHFTAKQATVLSEALLSLDPEVARRWEAAKAKAGGGGGSSAASSRSSSGPGAEANGSDGRGGGGGAGSSSGTVVARRATHPRARAGVTWRPPAAAASGATGLPPERLYSLQAPQGS